jgi:hypothetical protein
MIPPPEYAKAWCPDGRASMTGHVYVWGGYSDGTCTEANGHTTTARVSASGVYDLETAAK